MFDYSSIKSCRVVRSVLSTQTFGLSDKSDDTSIIQHDQKSILKKNLKITIRNDNATLFKVLIRNRNTTGKLLMLDIKDTREASNDGIIDEIIWFHRKYNLADAMKETIRLPNLVQALIEGKLHYEIEQSITMTTTTAEQEKKKAECGNDDISTTK